MNRLLPWLMLCALTTHGFTQEPSAIPGSDNPIYLELRALRDRAFEQYQTRNLEGLLKDLSEDILITWQNGERQLNRKQFVEFYEKMMRGDNRVVKDMKSEFAVDGLSILYGDTTAVAYGSCVDHFQLTSGKDFTLHSKWTATVVKTDGQWKIASFHISANLFDNPILSMAQAGLLYSALAGGVVVIAVGLLLAFVLRRSNPRRSAA